MKYSMLHNNGKANYQTDWNTIGGAMSYYEKDNAIWAIVVEVSTGKIVHHFNLNDN